MKKQTKDKNEGKTEIQDDWSSFRLDESEQNNKKNQGKKQSSIKLKQQTSQKNKIQIDNDISKAKNDQLKQQISTNEKVLIKWEDQPNDQNDDNVKQNDQNPQDIQQQNLRNMTLNDLDDGKQFKQFEGKKTTYDENQYTTNLDQNKFTKEEINRAEQLEKEIQNKDAYGNTHLAEDRNQQEQNDEESKNFNEEMKYSGVIRNDKRNKHSPNKQKQNQFKFNNDKKKQNNQNNNQQNTIQKQEKIEFLLNKNVKQENITQMFLNTYILRQKQQQSSPTSIIVDWKHNLLFSNNQKQQFLQ